MSQDPFPSGPWTGFYNYSAGGSRHRMDLSLTFHEGMVTGAGADDIGRFVIRGAFDAGTHSVSWVKTYPGRHKVFYRGARDVHGIWGTWDIPPLSRGGFHIWPKGSGEGMDDWEEAEEPVDAVG